MIVGVSVVVSVVVIVSIVSVLVKDVFGNGLLVEVSMMSEMLIFSVVLVR